MKAFCVKVGQLEIYRKNFKPSPDNEKPHTIICVWALATENENEAWLQFESRIRWRIDRNKGVLGPLLPPEGAQRKLRPDETNYLESFKENALVGSIDNVERKLRKLATHLQIDELVIITWTHDHSVQRRSYELLADAFELNGQAVN